MLFNAITVQGILEPHIFYNFMRVFQLKAFCGLSIFLGLAICPAIIVLNILEITQVGFTFYLGQLKMFTTVNLCNQVVHEILYNLTTL